MEVVICRDEKHVGEVAADRIVTQLENVETPVLGFATGSSPLALYGELQRRVENGELDLSQAHGFALDEYVGLSPDHSLSYRDTIRRTVIESLGMNPDLVHVPNGFTADLAVAAEDFEAKMRTVGGVDVQILGVGTNGHIGFNEPTSSLSSRTRLKTLTQQTRADNARFFDDPDDVPTHCITQGLGTIMEARMCVLVASGPSKAQAIRDMVEGPVAAVCPASILQFHRAAVVVVDEEAASLLEHADYFRHYAAVSPQG